MKQMDPKKLSFYVQNFKNKKVLLLGDLMLDTYIWGNVNRISPEAPVPIVEVMRESKCSGGVGNVGSNIESLGATPLLVGVVGSDDAGQWIKESTSCNEGIFIDKKRPTTVKTRIIAHQQQVVRVDREKKSPISPATEELVLTFIKENKYEGIIISDYNKGLISPALIEKVLSFAEKNTVPVFVDPKAENFPHFSPVTLFTPNHFEAEKMVRFPCLTDSQVEKAGRKILSLISTDYIILKRGEHGMTVIEKEKEPIHIPTKAKEVYDVTGAGDTVIATASLALISGASIREAAVLSNIAAGIVVGKIGTASVNPSELISALQTEYS